MRVLLIDHEDSFVHNIEQALSASGAEVHCLRSTVPLKEALLVDPDAVVLSPGPGHPRDRRLTRLSRQLLERWDTERAFLGVCLGHQLIAEHYGGTVVRAPEPVHGDVARVTHDRLGLFEGVPSPTWVARYHSLIVKPESVPADLEVSARGNRGLVMALRHRVRPVNSVQFHPESYLTPAGPKLLRNFLQEARR
ncbi:MAG TPA: aminodeoxychorismate/anthranilate synthase component II [Thermoplasmata archaeon]|nr:aminodeoxychorismate/anthranilate synthase component II [Thermoplasmata archaeon]